MEKEKQVGMLRTMQRIRNFEIMASRIFLSGEIQGFVHVSTGQEAIATGVCASLRDSDYITSNHRGHGHMIAKGGEVDKMLAELTGKVTGYNGGKGGSMHISDIDKGVLGANGLLAQGMTIALGAAYTAKYNKTDNVAVAFFGDGASSEGLFHEAMNIASIWKLPVVFVCENNKYGVTTKMKDVIASDTIASRAKNYKMPGVTINGNNVMEVYETAKTAVERARKGEGPTLVECETTRITGHYIGDPAPYVPDEEKATWDDRDAIQNFKKELIENGIATKEEIELIEKEEDDRIKAALTYARESPYPEISAATEGVYTDMIEEGRNR